MQGSVAFPWRQNTGGHFGAFGSNPLDDALDAASSVATTEQERRRVRETENVVASLTSSHGSDIAQIGGLLRQASQLASSASTASSREEIGRTIVASISMAANAACPGIGAALQAATEALWLGAHAFGEALSAWLRRGDPWATAINRFLHAAGYSGGACNFQYLEGQGLARAYRDGWVIPLPSANTINGRRGAYQALEAEYDFFSRGVCSSTDPQWPLLEGLAATLRATARDLDSRLNRGEVIPSSDDQATKFMALMRKLRPGAEQRIADVLRGALEFKWEENASEMPAPSQIRTARSVRMWAANVGYDVTGSHLRDLFAFKVSSLPPDVFRGVSTSLLERNPANIPPDDCVQNILRYAKPASSFEPGSVYTSGIFSYNVLPYSEVLMAKILEEAAIARPFEPLTRSALVVGDAKGAGAGTVAVVGGVGIAALALYLALK